jgi:hypothetical protein
MQVSRPPGLGVQNKIVNNYTVTLKIRSQGTKLVQFVRDDGHDSFIAS